MAEKKGAPGVLEVTLEEADLPAGLGPCTVALCTKQLFTAASTASLTGRHHIGRPVKVTPGTHELIVEGDTGRGWFRGTFPVQVPGDESYLVGSVECVLAPGADDQTSAIGFTFQDSDDRPDAAGFIIVRPRANACSVRG